MSDYSESLRNDLMVNLSTCLSPQQLSKVLQVYDYSISSYDVSRKETSIISINSIPEAMKWYLASKTVESKSKGTIYQYRYRLTKFFAAVNKPLDQITANDIRIYLALCKQSLGNSDSTIDDIRRVLNAFFEWCVKNEYLQHNPVAKVEKIKFQNAKRDPLTSYELEELRYSCSCAREKALIDFLFSTGCRAGELVEVKLSDINWTSRSVIIRHGKGDKRRTVFFNAESEFSLRKYLESRSDDSEYLFVRSKRPFSKLSVRSIENLVKKIRQTSGIQKKCSPHVLRHTFATASIACDMPLEKLQALMGHSKPETTMIYAKIMEDDLRNAHQKVFY